MVDPRQPVVGPAPVQLAQIVNGPFPKIYFNGFSIAGGVTDMVLILQNGEQVVAAVQATYPVVKELAAALDKIVAESEKQLGLTHIPLVEAADRVQKSVKAAENAS